MKFHRFFSNKQGKNKGSCISMSNMCIKSFITDVEEF